MPATVVGLVIATFVVLPGLVYYSTTGRTRPGESFANYSPRILASGLVTSVATLSALILIGDYWAGVPVTRVSDLVGDASGYIATQTRRLVWTALSMLGASVLLAWMAGRIASKRPLLRPGQPHYSGTDPWWLVLQEEKLNEGYQNEAYAYIDLRNGGCVGGLIIWFSSQGGSYSERDIVLMPWARCSDEFARHGTVSSSKLRESLYGANVRECDVMLRLVVPGDQIARIYVRYVPAPGVQELRLGLDRWAKETRATTLQCKDTMRRVVVYVNGEERASVYRASGSVIFSLAHLRRVSRKQYATAEAYLLSRGATRVRRAKHTYTLQACALLYDGELHPGFVGEVLDPLIRMS